MKKSLATTSLLAGFILLIFLVYARTTDAQGSSENSQIQIGMDIAPVHLDLTGKNRSLVGLGSYIVNAQGGCNDCHTWRITDVADQCRQQLRRGWRSVPWPAGADLCRGISGGRPQVWPLHLTQLDPERRRPSCEADARPIHHNPADWRGQQEPSSADLTASAGHAVAGVRKHDRSGSEGGVRVLAIDPLRRQRHALQPHPLVSHRRRYGRRRVFRRRTCGSSLEQVRARPAEGEARRATSPPRRPHFIATPCRLAGPVANAVSKSTSSASRAGHSWRP